MKLRILSTTIILLTLGLGCDSFEQQSQVGVESNAPQVSNARFGSVCDGCATVFSLELDSQISAPDIEDGKGSRLAVSGTVRVRGSALGTARGVSEIELKVDRLLLDGQFPQLPGGVSFQEKIKKELEAPVLVKCANGAPPSVLRSSRQLSLTRSIWASVISRLQLTAAPQGSSTTWSAKEFDGTGRYRALYSVNDRLWTREKEAYLDVAEGKQLRPPSSGEAVLLDAVDVIRLDDDSMVTSMKARETLKFRHEIGLPELLVKTQIELTKVKSLDKVGEFTVPKAEWRSIYDTQQEGRSLELDLAKAAGRSAKEIVDALIASKPTDKREQERLALSLASALALGEGETAIVAEAAQQHVHLTPLLLMALSSAGTDEAQEQLLTLAKSKDSSPELSGHALVSLTLSQRPSEKTVEAVIDLMDSPRHQGQAFLGLGSMAYRLSKTNTELYRRALDELTSRFRHGRAERSDSWRLALKALGNTGDRHLPQLIDPELRDRDSSVRKDAVRALRRCHEAKDVLQRIASTDTEEFVRKEALASLSKISRNTG